MKYFEKLKFLDNSDQKVQISKGLIKPSTATHKYKMACKQTAIGQGKSGRWHLLDTLNTNIPWVAVPPGPTQFCTIDPNVTNLEPL